MSLSANQINALESLPNWQWLPTWEENLAGVQAFIADKNRFPLHTSSDEQEKRLAIWCLSQKRIKQFQDDRQRRIQTTETTTGGTTGSNAPGSN